ASARIALAILSVGRVEIMSRSVFAVLGGAAGAQIGCSSQCAGPEDRVTARARILPECAGGIKIRDQPLTGLTTFFMSF
ncbi:hypothetical protein ABTF56_19955, partial [Acinetobacter baumannii]